MAKPTKPTKSAPPKKPTTKAKVTAAPKPRARTLRTGPTAKTIERYAQGPDDSKRRRERITRLVQQIAEIAVLFEPVGDDQHLVSADAIEKHLWAALTQLTGIRLDKTSARK